MSAQNTARLKASGTLTAVTAYKVHLTQSVKPLVEVAHHGVTADGTTAAVEPIWVAIANNETDLPAGAAFTDEWDVVLPGERLPIPTSLARSGVWVVLYSAGVPSFTVSGFQ